MSRIGTVESYEQTEDGGEVVVDLGGGERRTAEHFAPAGDDSPPLPGDAAAVEDSSGQGRLQVTGYDDDTPKMSLSGERRFYGRDANGNVVNEMHLRRDGTIYAENANASITISPGGVMTSKAKIIVLDGDEVRLRKGGRPVATVGSAVSVSVNPVVDLTTGKYIGAGQVVSGDPNVTTGG